MAWTCPFYIIVIQGAEEPSRHPGVALKGFDHRHQVNENCPGSFKAKWLPPRSVRIPSNIVVDHVALAK